MLVKGLVDMVLAVTEVLVVLMAMHPMVVEVLHTEVMGALHTVVLQVVVAMVEM